MVLHTLSYQDKYDSEYLFLLLSNRFVGLCDAIEAKYGTYINPSSELPWIRRQYMSKSRLYHNIRHITFTLELYDIIRQDIKDVEKRMAMQFALIYHDIIYIPERGDTFNIKESIGTAEYSLSGDSLLDFRLLVKKYIMATDHNRLINDIRTRNFMSKEEKYISDMDLYSFALPMHMIHINSSRIRTEFEYLSDEEFNKGNTEFLQSVLNLKDIYLTKFFGKFTEIARKNIESLILSRTNN